MSTIDIFKTILRDESIDSTNYHGAHGSVG